jgi:hypothetical protein
VPYSGTTPKGSQPIPHRRQPAKKTRSQVEPAGSFYLTVPPKGRPAFPISSSRFSPIGCNFPYPLQLRAQRVDLIFFSCMVVKATLFTTGGSRRAGTPSAVGCASSRFPSPPCSGHVARLSNLGSPKASLRGLKWDNVGKPQLFVNANTG